MQGDAGSYLGSTPLIGLGLAFLGGAGTSFTPCVYPVVPITVAYIGARSSGVAKGATEAHALATAVFVLGPEEGIALLESLPDTAGVIVGLDGEVRTTSGFDMQRTLSGDDDNHTTHLAFRQQTQMSCIATMAASLLDT